MILEKRTVHQADCDVWDLPKASDNLHPAPGPDAATERYLAQMKPAYDGLARVLAQLSGVFLLALTRDGAGPGLHLDHPVYTIALNDLAEARETIGGVVAPDAGRHHRAGLVDLADRLADTAAGMDRMTRRRIATDRESDKRAVLQHLAAAQRLLVATAEPDAGLTPVDFDHACCNCAPKPALG